MREFESHAVGDVLGAGGGTRGRCGGVVSEFRHLVLFQAMVVSLVVRGSRGEVVGHGEMRMGINNGYEV